MSFDALTLAAVTQELRETILGGKIQRVLLTGELSMALEIYAQHRRIYLLLSAHPRFARIHLTRQRPTRGIETPTPFLLLLRKYVNGGRIVAIEQPDLERIVLLSIAKRPNLRNLPHEQPGGAPEAPEEPVDTADDIEQDDAEFDDSELLRCDLAAEIMEQRSNIILVSDENLVMESIKRVTPKMSRRVVLPREPYELPPAQNKRDPRHATPEGMQSLLERGAFDLARAIVGAYRGISPLAAREAVFRATGRTDLMLTPDLPWDALSACVRELWTAPAEPCLTPQTFAAYRLTHLGGGEAVASMSLALEQFYGAYEQVTSHQQRRAQIRAELLETRERLERQQRALRSELERAGDLERLRWEGEMIFAYIHQVQPRQREIVIEGRTITLDPLRSAVENAQERFRAYEKARNALAGVPERLHEVEARLAGLHETIELLELAEGYEAIESMAQEAIEEGYLRPDERRKRKKNARMQQPLRIVSSDGFTIYAGRSARQNQQVTFTIGGSDDIWLHARGIPGAHVIIKNGGRPVPERTIIEAAQLAAYHSPARNEAAVDIDIARRNQVRRIREGPPGLVSYHAERTVRVAPKAATGA